MISSNLVLYGTKYWTMNKRNENKVKITEMEICLDVTLLEDKIKKKYKRGSL